MDLLFEIGLEELPHGFIPGATAQLAEKTKTLLAAEALSHGVICAYSTPRRLALWIKDLPESQPDRENLRKGPLLNAAFQNGSLAPAGKGFLKSFGLENVDEKSLADWNKVPGDKIKKDGAYFREEGGQVFLYGYQFVKGRETARILSGLLPKVIASLEFPKTMRWADLDFPFARPIRWILALFGSKVVPFEIAGIVSGNATCGHPQFFPRSESVTISKPEEYLDVLRSRKVLADPEERKESIRKQIEALEKKEGLRFLETGRVIPIVRDLTEWPHLVVASFDPDFLRLPREVLISEMVEHQKYFPVEDLSGKLLPRFVITSNIENESFVIRGNLKVLTSRLRDGAFLYEEDLKTGLAFMGEKLRSVTYMKELGTVWEKTDRTVRLARQLSETLRLSKPDTVEKIGRVMKNDLASKMVYEFPALQGVIGEYYTRHEAGKLGLEPRHAQAVREHYMPLGAGAGLPETEEGILLALAEKMETIAGHFAIGNIPTGSQDPYALRRQALGIIRILVEKKYALSLLAVFSGLAKDYEPYLAVSKAFPDAEKFCHSIMDFFQARFKGYLKDAGFAADEIDALPEGGVMDFHDLVLRLETLKTYRLRPDFIKYAGIRKRISNILEKSPSVKAGPEVQPNPSLFSEPAENELFDFHQKVSPEIKNLHQKKDYAGLMDLGLRFFGPIETFFEKVHIEDKDEAKRQNRMDLLRMIDRELGDDLRIEKLKV